MAYRNDPLPHEDESNTHGRHGYSLLRAINAVSNPYRKEPPGSPPPGLEGETHKELEKRHPGVNFKGFLIPTFPGESRALTTSSGSGAIGTHVPDLAILDVLRARSVLGSLGAQVLKLPPDAKGNTWLPRRATAASVGWIAEGGAAPVASPTTDAVQFTPKTVSSTVSVTRKLLKSAWEAEHELRIIADMVASFAVEVDRMGIVGTGGGNTPTGLLYTAGINVVPLGANGAAPNRAALVELERLVGIANGDAAVDVALGWFASPNARAKLRLTDGSAAGSGAWLWSDDDRILGKPAVASNNAPSTLTKGSGTNLSAIGYGNFRDVVVNLFGPVDVVIDPHKQVTDGVVKVSAFLDVDVQLLHAPSFGAILDALTA
ncbi:phage major capsid protein [Paludisphaera mucosa]|uniref:Phage major capsid protein n=1 Tax=Paludisphaera mucosa TaxID=3030827 RepID=A0ABT6FGC9_9BACT|nr:phage major capsid protein [Paludisphaera mucosa]MDG3006618.1 phage major capsid protein [Paludisphaera mucosa]